MKTFEQFTDDDIRRELEENKNKLHLQIGDIVDLDLGHTAKDSRVFAEVIKLFIPGGIARVKSIICNRIPYLCDHEFETIVDAFDLSLKADMEIFNNKMVKPKIKISKEDPLGEENWDDDDEDYRSFESNNELDPFGEEDWDDKNKKITPGYYKIRFLKTTGVLLSYGYFDDDDDNYIEDHSTLFMFDINDEMNIDVLGAFDDYVIFTVDTGDDYVGYGSMPRDNFEII